MPFLIALALYGGSFVGYVIGDTHAIESIKQEVSPDMEEMRCQMSYEIKQIMESK